MVSLHLTCRAIIRRKHTFLETNVTMHAHTPMHVLKVIPTKHTLKLLFGLPKQEVAKAYSI